MRVLVQWTTDNPGDWVEVDSADWASIARAPVPLGGERIGSVAGWIYALCIQGVVFEGWDHYAVFHRKDDLVQVYVWRDDPDDYGPEKFRGEKWSFRTLAPDLALGGAVNTRQDVTRYASGEPIDFSMFPRAKLNADHVRHGIWVPDGLVLPHRSRRSVRGWREWSDGVAHELLDASGRVATQRPLGRYLMPDGTRTYYHNSDQETSAHGAENKNQLGVTPSGYDEETGNNISPGTSEMCFTAVSPENEPGFAQWPTGSYRYQLDVVAIGSDVQYGLLAIGSHTGHFGRVDGTIDNCLEMKQQQEGYFTGTGLNLATTGSVSWSAGNGTDRFEIAVVAYNASDGHSAQDITLGLGEYDDFADGPWAAADEDGQIGMFLAANM